MITRSPNVWEALLGAGVDPDRHFPHNDDLIVLNTDITIILSIIKCQFVDS